MPTRALIGGVQTSFEQPLTAIADPGAAPQRNDDELVVELPSHLPVLTPGLARALGRVLVKAARASGNSEVRASDAPEVLAS